MSLFPAGTEKVDPGRIESTNAAEGAVLVADGSGGARFDDSGDVPASALTPGDNGQVLVTVDDAAAWSDDIDLPGNAVIGGTLDVTGVTTLGETGMGAATADSLEVTGATTLDSVGAAAVTAESVASTGAVTSSSPTAGIGYATGSGGAVTQETDKSTGVASNTLTTAITMNGAELADATAVSFTFTNTAVAATDTVLVTHQSAGTSGAYVFNAFPGAGSAVITVRNVSGGALSEAIVLRVTVIKSVSA